MQPDTLSLNNSRNIKFKLDNQKTTAGTYQRNSIQTYETFSKRNSRIPYDNFSTNIKQLMKPRPSLVSLNPTQSKTRHDIYGNEIKKGSKKHKISFIDEISNEKFAEITIVVTENVGKKNRKQKNEEVHCDCQSCLIF